MEVRPYLAALRKSVERSSVAIRKSEIYRALWDSCDALRGQMDASQYKDYILTLLFVKYVSDKYAGQKFADIIVPPGGSFTDMLAAKNAKDIGERLDKVVAALAAANQLQGVIDNVSFNDPNKLGSANEMVGTLSKLVGIFSDAGLDFSRNRADGDDLLGDAYEYLMRNFATESGKSKGQFYTPAEVSIVIARLIGIDRATDPQMSIYDPACGSGSLLLKAHDEAPADISIFGQEKDSATRGLAKMNMILHGCGTARVEVGDTLASPKLTERGGELMLHDFVVANPPFSQKNWRNGFDDKTPPENDRFGRFGGMSGYEVPPQKNGDYAFVLHMVASLKPTGTAAVVLPHGVLFRGGAEAKIREKLLRRGLVKGVVGLPANLFYGTGIPACILVLDKRGAQARRPVFMIDASKGFLKDGPKNRLRAQDVHRIIDVFGRQTDAPGYARLVPFDEIERNGFNLNIPRYVDSSEPEDIHDIAAHLKGGIPNADLDALAAYWALMPGLRAALFGPGDRPGYSDPLAPPERVRETIHGHPEFAAFRASVMAVFEGWRDAHVDALRAVAPGAKPKQIVHDLAEDMLARFRTAPLLDPYDAYQQFMSYAAAEMLDDLYLLAADGWDAARRLREVRLKPDGKPMEDADIELGAGRKKVKLVAEMIPPALIVARFFAAEQAAIDAQEADLEALGREIEEMAEEHGGEEGLLAEALTDDGALTAASVKARLKALRGEKKPDADEMAQLRAASVLFERQAEAKRALAEARQALVEAVARKYPALSDAEAKYLVVQMKWIDRIQGSICTEIENLSWILIVSCQRLTSRYTKNLTEICNRVAFHESRFQNAIRSMGLAS